MAGGCFFNATLRKGKGNVVDGLEGVGYRYILLSLLGQSK